ncbi:MAG TPA: ABC transporter substrate-binding protein [Hydrogenophaga sp.]|jgi:TRAP-type mannitol/chloroaromatic compound transport system substrate-binding protein|uniref:TRAP transporter substrate-binding protein n=1 Tax=Hydrogenophaga sp. TaxID=1904254 RepID=UPI0008AB7490|nr:TRAP transporter substrate-binding protein [Hydrogenophaga sp.]MBU4183774.1 TRAP transporter substrate-binding protein [Gammaproteobacteria bacterium]OGA78094.1 MAG: ABC transporter substrate-binding protein [Burkholderiales bacterium GWE1_65_30]OGA94445.1 MAG: ABC transporter substrate-binding protein [Burkholderiales bacterium GWF1_66_17]OGB36751.1 MAG: ABC transporter substrate-binding protein [Burkholderiales bacterium RIFCSPLOWO2_02_FULL_66_35]PKO77222.1 MAG: ABC transporter substrate-
MDRRSIIKHAGIAGVLAAGAAPAVHAQATIRWRLASSFPKALDTIFGAADVFAKKVGDMTGGKFSISVHPGGELMPAFGVVDGVQQGTVEAAHTAPYYFFGKDDTFAMGTAIPFGLNSRQLTAWYYDGNGLKLFREFYDKYNIVNFPGGNTGAQMGGWYRKEIKGVADIKGLKMRIGGFAGKVFTRMGGVPQNIPGGEIYQALEKGTIDATEWVGPYDDEKLGFQKVAKNYYYPGWWEGGAQLDFYINKTAFNALSKENQAIVEAAAAYAHTEMQARYDARNPAALKRLVAGGAKVLPFPKAVMDLAYKESMALYAELNDTNPAWKKIYTDYSAFRKDQNLWFRFTEAQFDRYMQSAKL